MSNHIKRMRVFAGPNGSGKSTIIKEIQQQVFTGTYINADDIEKAFKDKGFINLGDFGLETTLENFLKFLNQSTLVAKALNEGYKIDLTFSDNVIKVAPETNNSYAAALIAEYLRNLLIVKGETFSFETVMSHESKLSMFQWAQRKVLKITFILFAQNLLILMYGAWLPRLPKEGIM